jgi:gamma-glutamylaminecyclotransferase
MKLFVYGSLKRGYWNNILLEQINAHFLADVMTEPIWTLRDVGAFPALESGGQNVVSGELWEVPEAGLQFVDALEGHPNWYHRESISVIDSETGEIIEAQTYVNNRYQEAPIILEWPAKPQARPTAGHPRRLHPRPGGRHMRAQLILATLFVAAGLLTCPIDLIAGSALLAVGL